MEDNRPSYYAVIPASVRFDDRLPTNAKLLYGEITALANTEGFCYASNAYFAKCYNLSERTVSSLISKLNELHYIDVVLEKDDNSGQVQRRKIYLRVSASDERPLAEIFYVKRNYFPGEGEDFFQENIAGDNNLEKENKKEKDSGQSKRHAPLTDEQVKQLCIDWAGANGSDRDEKNGLYFALMGFYAPREKAKQEPARTVTAFNTLTGRLTRYSGGSVPTMIDMLERAITAGWKSVFPLQGDRGAGQPVPDGRDEVWL